MFASFEGIWYRHARFGNCSKPWVAKLFISNRGRLGRDFVKPTRDFKWGRIDSSHKISFWYVLHKGVYEVSQPRPRYDHKSPRRFFIESRDGDWQVVKYDDVIVYLAREYCEQPNKD